MWDSASFAMTMNKTSEKLVVRAMNKNDVLQDDVLGTTCIGLDVLATLQEPVWFQLGRGNGYTVKSGEVLLSAQFFPLVSSDAAAMEQKAIMDRKIEEQRVQFQQQQFQQQQLALQQYQYQIISQQQQQLQQQQQTADGEPWKRVYYSQGQEGGVGGLGPPRQLLPLQDYEVIIPEGEETNNASFFSAQSSSASSAPKKATTQEGPFGELPPLISSSSSASSSSSSSSPGFNLEQRFADMNK